MKIKRFARDIREDSSGNTYTMLLTETPDGEVKVNVPVVSVLEVLDIWEELVLALGFGKGSDLAVVRVSKVAHGVDMNDIINPDQSTIYDHLDEVHDEVSRAPLNR